MPTLFSPDFLHQLSPLLPLPLQPGNLSEKAPEQGGEREKKTSESSRDRGGRGGGGGGGDEGEADLITPL